MRSPILTLHVSNFVSTVNLPSGGDVYATARPDTTTAASSRNSPDTMRRRVPDGTDSECDTPELASVSRPTITATG